MVSGTGDYAKTQKEKLEQQLLPYFPDIEITVEAYPEEQYYTLLNTKLSMGEGPDFFDIQPNLAGPNAVQKLAPAGYLEPLDDLELVQKAPACTIQTQAEAVCDLFGGKKENIKVIGIRHGEKMYETLLTNEECAKAEDMGNFYRVPADNRGLNYDKYFKEGETERNTLTEFNSNNTRILNVEETKAKIAALDYIKKELNGEGNFVQ